MGRAHGSGEWQDHRAQCQHVDAWNGPEQHAAKQPADEYRNADRIGEESGGA